MGHFDLVAAEIEGAGWHCFLSALEDGYVIYHFEDVVAPELIYADWDLTDGVEHVRLIDPNADYHESEIIRCDISGSDDGIIDDLRNFLWEAGSYVG